MNKKKKKNNNNKNLIIIGSIALVVLIGIILFFTFFKKDDVIEEETCKQLTGGSFTLNINKNNGEDGEEISICIACSPDSYTKIDDPVYNGYTFVGWYYDSEYTNKAEFETTLDIEPIQEKDNNGCVTGYKTQELYARWAKCPDGYTYSNDICTLTKKTDATPTYKCSEGTLSGSKCVLTDNVIYECSASGWTKKGYATSKITDGKCKITYKNIKLSDDAIVVGEFDFANNKCGNVAQGTCEVYVVSTENHNMCNSGYTYSNKKCIKKVNATVSKYTCSEGTLDGKQCIITKTSTPTYQ